MQSISVFPCCPSLTSHLSSQLSSNGKIIVWVYFLLFGRTHGLCPHVFLRGRCLLLLSEVILTLCALHFGFSCAHIHCLLCNISSSPLGLSCSSYMKRKNLCLRDTPKLPIAVWPTADFCFTVIFLDCMSLG